MIEFNFAKYLRADAKGVFYMYDTGHFALETHAAEIGQEISSFLTIHL